MANVKRICVLLATLLCGLAGCGEPERDTARALADRFDELRAFEDLERQVRIGPRPSGSAASRRLTRLLARRLRDAGARQVAIQRPYRNVVARIPGGAPGSVVVGAHHDTKDGIPGFVGANDGASGVAVVLELVRALAPRVDGPTIHVALFDAEEARGTRSFDEDGTRGSRQYVRYARGGRQGTPRLDAIEAMVLFDLVGDCDLDVPLEANSDPALYEYFRDAARELEPDGDGEPFVGTRGPIGDDHVPFLEAGIPAVDLIDFAYGPGAPPGEWWHTAEDTADKTCPRSLGAVGRPALLALSRLR